MHGLLLKLMSSELLYRLGKLADASQNFKKKAKLSAHFVSTYFPCYRVFVYLLLCCFSPLVPQLKLLPCMCEGVK